MLRHHDGFEVTCFGTAGAAVRNGFSEGALIIKNARAIADESLHGAARSDVRLREGQIACRPCVVKKKITRVRLQIEQSKINLCFPIAGERNRNRSAPKQFANSARRSWFQFRLYFATVASRRNQ